MRVLIVHHEARYFGGAEVLLGYFLPALRETGADVTVALARGSRMAHTVPAGMDVLHIPASENLSPTRIGAQLLALARAGRLRNFDVVHGWTARDWELASVVGAVARRPTLGTLHDHPRATYLSPKRQRLMRIVANRGLDRVACPSEAARGACMQDGYRAEKIAVVHNGIPIPPSPERQIWSGSLRLGFLGTLSESKGLSGLFEMIAALDRLNPGEWQLQLGGAPQDAAGEGLVAAIHARYSTRSWWPRVSWMGWVKDQNEFLRGIDVLVCPSAEFETFGLVLCEAGAAKVPAVATSVGAVPEIVSHGKTGWLVEPGDWNGATKILADLIGSRQEILRAGEAARVDVAQRFSIAEMASGYRNLYSGIS